MSELESAFDAARHEDECQASNDQKLTPEFISAEIEAGLDQMLARVQDPCVHKIAAQMIINRMIEYHTQMALTVRERAGDDPAAIRCATAWMRDAGKFQAIAGILENISLGENDFACSQNEG